MVFQLSVYRGVKIILIPVYIVPMLLRESPISYSGSLLSRIPGRRQHILRITVGIGFCGHPAYRGLAAGCLLSVGREPSVGYAVPSIHLTWF